LPVGHTHELIDQIFACFAIWLKNHNVLTYQQFMSDLEGTYSPGVKVHKMEEMGDWQRFLKETGCNYDFHNHTHWRAFEIGRNSNGKLTF
jgi:hypothetical protein